MKPILLRREVIAIETVEIDVWEALKRCENMVECPDWDALNALIDDRDRILRQCDELIAIMPRYADSYIAQRDAALAKLAKRIRPLLPDEIDAELER